MTSETTSEQHGVRTWTVHRIEVDNEYVFNDVVVVEEPLELRITYGPSALRTEIPLSVTMRTPGDDLALATGFMITEGIVHSMKDILSVDQPSENVVVVHLHPDFVFLPEKIQRHFYTTSSCGICGKASIDMVRQVSSYRLIPGQPQIPFGALVQMGEILRNEQPVFAATGGIHATALFDAASQLLCTKEDIGRHNAMDKMIGWAAAQNLLPLTHHLVVVSGRGGFELIQKASAAGVAIFAAVGAPSSLALELAEESDMTVAGFLRGDRVNVYTHPERVVTK
ncbi:MAG TPA: formate dehydrogenase accessory sulfurtransferase FdhD [Saprospiraceae bacterium]|nr:formate dehydrogenase accessory sulfurtransferase FdhD [Saprospiraceae bacterium]